MDVRTEAAAVSAVRNAPAVAFAPRDGTALALRSVLAVSPNPAPIRFGPRWLEPEITASIALLIRDLSGGAPVLSASAAFSPPKLKTSDNK